jgi:CRISPR-associated exonuclease Cas4
MFTEDDLLPISALQHLAFCERQWALIHLERVWNENALTAEGRHQHERVHDDDLETRGDVRIAHSLQLRSFRLGLVGQADVVEFAPDAAPHIVEHKHGKPKLDSSDEIQLCAQALCLEEMLGVSIPEGDIFYGRIRRRHRVVFTEDLRRKTEDLAARLHDLTEKRVTPPASSSPRCDNCSLNGACMPGSTNGKHSAQRYIADFIAAARCGEGEEGAP